MASAEAMLRATDGVIAALTNLLHQSTQPKVAVYHAIDFVTGSVNPTFARVVAMDVDTNRVIVLGVINKDDGETYPEFVARAKGDADRLGAPRLVFGGIPPTLSETDNVVLAPADERPLYPVAHRVKLINTRLHADQVRALRLIQSNRFVVLRNGRRWGKTRLLEAVIVDDVLLGRDVGYFAPSYGLCSPTVNSLISILRPIASTVNKGAAPRLIALPGGGSVELWSLDTDKVSRGRGYSRACIDEAAYVEGDMNHFYDASIRPALADRKGSALVTSTPSGIDSSQWFFRINHIDELKFKRFHAPTINNPIITAEEIEELRVGHNPLVFQQEFEGQFIDLSGVSLFDINKMLVNGEPLDIPTLDEHFENEDAWSRTPKLYDRVFITADCTMKGGPEGDASAFLIVAENANFPGLPKGMLVLDWFTSEAGEGDLDSDFKFVVGQYIKYARRAREGGRGIFIEDTGLGSHLLRAYSEFGTEAFDSGWVALGKNPRVMASLPYVNRGEIKMSRTAYEKRTTLKSNSASHLRTQLLNYRANDKKARARADDLVDVFTMATIKCWDLECPVR